MPKDWPSWKEMEACRLEEGPSAGTIIEVAPTMVNITHKGERYFRMDKTRYQEPETERWMGVYLWDGWGDQLRAKMALKGVMNALGHTTVRGDG